MRPDEHIDRLDAESSTFVDLAQTADLSRRVPGCDDWTVRELCAHVGQLLRWSSQLVETHRLEAANLQTLGITTPDGDDELLSWLADAREQALAIFRTEDLSEPVWGWAGDHRGWFWPRRMLCEVAVHKTDLQRALGQDPSLDAGLIVEGIDEHLSILPWTAVTDPAVANLRGAGESIGLHADDGPRWRIRLIPGGILWDRSDAETTATVTGPLLDLYMHTQGRPNACQVSGDVELHAKTLGSLSF
jgi:uncharacterized protein (TIGR03083 family)